MITALPFLPVTAILAWIYRQLLPGGRRWIAFDSARIAVVPALAAAARRAGARP